MERKRSVLTGDKSDRIRQESSDHKKVEKPKRSKWVRRVLDLVDNIVTALT